jgi:anti-sigma regulatory factor (Ser/Thr protein kinase)
VQVTVRLELPRDAATIPVLRRLCGRSLEVVGAEPAVIEDLQLALTEACANVLEHVENGASFEVRVGFDEHVAFLDVIDSGGGFDPTQILTPGPEDEGGRGLQLMRGLMDSVRFDSVSGSGTTVHLEKRMAWTEDAVIHELTIRNPTVSG